MKIKVYPQREFNNTVFNDDNVEKYPHDFFICLNSSGHIYSIPHFKHSHDNVINTYFDDTDIDRIKTTGNLVYYARACTSDQAVKIRNFIDTIPQDATVHIYCAKGQSRSPAVAKFIEEYKNSNIDNRYSNYNHHVYQLLGAVC
jgi:predicted protein tyrosine phosphatase